MRIPNGWLMMSRFVQPLRNHLPVLLIVPLVVIATTWPTFPRIFDPDEFWLHVVHHDKWLRIWDAWHIEQVLAGQADLFYTDSWFHPQGTTLRFYSYVYPHALLLIALKAVLPVDDAYNLLFLLILCFNAFCGYALIKHLIKDKWISLFGSIVFLMSAPFPNGSTVPDLITIGTLPLAMYFYLRAESESNWRFAILAGISAGVTVLISVYVFAFILLSFGIYALFKSLSLWKRRAFWRNLLIFVVFCGSISLLRFYPMLLDRAQLLQAVEVSNVQTRSNDVLEFFVLPNNPFTGPLFGEPIDAREYHVDSLVRRQHKEGYLGYINIFLVACAFLFQPRRRRLLPWAVILVFFAVLRLGTHLTFNGVEYADIVLPQRLLRDWFPALFANIGYAKYYDIGMVMPLAALSSYGLAALLRSKPVKARMLVSLFCALVVTFEFYIPRLGQTIEAEKTAFVPWLQSEPADEIKLIHLPMMQYTRPYYLHVHMLTDYPQANGFGTRLKWSARSYIEDNLLLHHWHYNRNVHCLPHNQQSFSAALEQLSEDGFTHIIAHNWLYGDQFTRHSFGNIPAAYDDGFVRIYRLRDMHQSCVSIQAIDPAREDLSVLAGTSWLVPGKRSSILSFHPTDSIDADRFAYYNSLFADWDSLLHLYFEDGELAKQYDENSYPNIDVLRNESQVIYFTYNTRDSQTMHNGIFDFERFELCQRNAHDDGAVIEQYVSRDFSCELVTSASGFTAQYDNGARLENLLFAADQDQLDLQLQWSHLPDEVYSVSIQVFDASGEKVLGQDSVIGHVSLARHRVDVSSLPPGDYSVKLIMYNFNSGAVVSGTESRDGARFDRELVIGNLNHN